MSDDDPNVVIPEFPDADEQADEAELGPVAAAQTERDRFEALRNRLAGLIDSPSTPARDMPPLIRRFEEITDRLDAIQAREDDRAKAEAAGGSAVDEPYDPLDL